MENKNRCMMCSYFKRTDKDLPDFSTCTKNDFEVVSSDLACGDFDYALCGKCKNYNPCQFDSYHGYCQKNRGNKVVYGRAICDKFEPKETTGRYPWVSYKNNTEEYEKILNDILDIVYEQPEMFEHNISAYELLPGRIKFFKNSWDTMCDKYDPVFEENTKLKEEINKYEKMLLDIYSALHPYRAKVKNLTLEKAFSKLPEKVKAKVETYEDNLTKYQYALGEKADIIDELRAENTKLKDVVERLKGSNNDLKESYNHLLKNFKRENEAGSKIVEENVKLEEEINALKNDISKLKDRADGNYKASIRKDELIKSLRHEKKAKDDEIMILKWRNDNQCRMIQDLKKERDEFKERCHSAEADVTILNSKVEVLDKRNTNQSVMIGEKGKEIENLKKKNRELQIRVNDLLFQEKLNKSAFGYDYEEENGKLRVENERLRNENELLRNRYPTYSAMKAEDKIEHIQKEARKWKDKYKEAYDILQEFFGEHSNISSVGYHLSGDYLTLKLSYDVRSAGSKYESLKNARERMKKLD